MVSKELLSELRDIFKDDYGIILSESDLLKVAQFLVEYFDILGNMGISKL